LPSCVGPGADGSTKTTASKAGDDTRNRAVAAIRMRPTRRNFTLTTFHRSEEFDSAVHYRVHPIRQAGRRQYVEAKSGRNTCAGYPK